MPWSPRRRLAIVQESVDRSTSLILARMTVATLEPPVARPAFGLSYSSRRQPYKAPLPGLSMMTMATPTFAVPHDLLESSEEECDARASGASTPLFLPVAHRGWDDTENDGARTPVQFGSDFRMRFRAEARGPTDGGSPNGDAVEEARCLCTSLLTASRLQRVKDHATPQTYTAQTKCPESWRLCSGARRSRHLFFGAPASRPEVAVLH